MTSEALSQLASDLRREPGAPQRTQDDDQFASPLNQDPTELGHHPRTYQLEMLEQSLRRNIIVAMDTGSGKSLIAILRIQAEIERCPEHKLVWFLAPNVALATQQAKAIMDHIPSIQSRVLVGADGVDRWTNQWVWDQVLDGIRVVTSTYQVLLDALVHGFVRMMRLSLIVFDEAHHCIASHPANRIMQDFYHSRDVADQDQLPSILGLTASPIIKNKAGDLEVLETNLNAISRSPKLHRDELLRYVFVPKLILIVYPSFDKLTKSQALDSLVRIRASLNVEEDPWVIALRSDESTRKSAQLRKAILDHKTHCQHQLKSLNRKGEIIHQELGSFAADWYISRCVQRLQSNIPDYSTDFDSLPVKENAYLRYQLSGIQLLPSSDSELLLHKTHLSPKFHMLVDFLVGQESASFSGLVFVKTRAEVSVLAHLLSIYFRTRDAFTVSTFVGASNASGQRADISELVDLKLQKDTLADFRSGQKNLVVATAALEEGINISACNVVVCFEKPPNLKSFIQRRGRARKSESKFVLMLSADEDPKVIRTWQQLENDMQQAYQDDMRLLREIQAIEEMEETDMEFIVESTGAKMTLADSISHLNHFCATLPNRGFGVSKPIFVFNHEANEGVGRSIIAKVTLPISVDPSMREASSTPWQTEKNAKRHAAFEAYIKLYHGGLISENLLPFQGYQKGDSDPEIINEKVASIIEVSDQVDPWYVIAAEWRKAEENETCSEATITIYDGDCVIAAMQILLPCLIPSTPTVSLHWNESTLFTAVIGTQRCISYSRADMHRAAQVTSTLLSSVFAKRMIEKKLDFAALFVPPLFEEIQTWLDNHRGTDKVQMMMEKNLLSSANPGIGLVRDLSKSGTAFIFNSVQDAPDNLSELLSDGKSAEGGQPDNDLYLTVSKFPKRADFIHEVPIQNREQAVTRGTHVLRAQNCAIDRLPFKYSCFAVLVPSILHYIGVHLLTGHLCDTLLSSLNFADLSLVRTAISTTAAREPVNYQRQEFLGDSVLKFFASLTLMSTHLQWHEGLLSRSKDHIVSNYSLQKAAVKQGLDRYIITKPFTGKKWRPAYVFEILERKLPENRRLSTKTLADVVEALIGGSMLDGGYEKALGCLRIFLPDVPWSSVEQMHNVLNSSYQFSLHFPPQFSHLETLIGYSFNLKSLPIEALTHSSYLGPNTSSSYERLEFLGDAVLDSIVVSTAYAHEPPIPTHTLHLIRTTVVNGPFLAFLCLYHSTPITRIEMITNSLDKSVAPVETQRPLHIWMFMRYFSPEIRRAQQACLARFESLRDRVVECLARGTSVPWALLAHLDAPKFFSDIIEALLGAIFIDSDGSMGACEAFLEQLGVMGYLRRVMSGTVALYHPKEELGQLVDTEQLRYECSTDGSDRAKLTCVVWVGEREVARVEDGSNRIEVETRAAEEAVRVLKSER
ncbi:MAG: hypothetical protein Q9167_003149 [Letrouitia subvulpina]